MIKSVLRRSKAFYKINPTFNSCPSCKSSGTIMHSHSRNIKEKLISKFSLHKYYRCKKCGWRGLLSTVRITSASFIIILLYIMMIIGAGFITYQILKRLM
jgi:hypothetical protein